MTILKEFLGLSRNTSFFHSLAPRIPCCEAPGLPESGERFCGRRGRRLFNFKIKPPSRRALGKDGKGAIQKTQTFGEAEFTKFLFGFWEQTRRRWSSETKHRQIKNSPHQHRSFTVIVISPLVCGSNLHRPKRSCVPVQLTWAAKTAAQFGPQECSAGTAEPDSNFHFFEKFAFVAFFPPWCETAANPSNWAASLEWRADSWDFLPTQLN